MMTFAEIVLIAHLVMILLDIAFYALGLYSHYAKRASA